MSSVVRIPSRLEWLKNNLLVGKIEILLESERSKKESVFLRKKERKNRIEKEREQKRRKEKKREREQKRREKERKRTEKKRKREKENRKEEKKREREQKRIEKERRVRVLFVAITQKDADCNVCILSSYLLPSFHCCFFVVIYEREKIVKSLTIFNYLSFSTLEHVYG